MEQFLKEATAATCVGGLWDAFVDYFRERGFHQIAYVHFPRPGTSEQGQNWARLQSFPDEWIEHLLERGLIDDDPIRAQAMVHPAPFKWSEIGSLRQLTPKEQAFLDSLRQFHSGDGVAIPVFGPGGRNGFTGIFLPEGVVDLPPEQLVEFQIVSQYAHQRYCALAREPERNVAALSPREQEVLRWVAQGKSNSVIADIIGVSANTVDTHMRRIYQKLHVSDRVSAVLAGLGQGLIVIE